MQTQNKHPVAKQTKVSAAACGKAIIVGEHAVVYGARALAIPLLENSAKFEAQLTGDQIVLLSGEREVGGFVREVIADAFRIFNIPQRGIIVRVRNCLPTGSGLGSSATLCVGVLRCITQLFDIELTEKELADSANVLEKRFHGNPSGLDTAVISHGRILGFSKEDGVSFPPVNGVFHFALVDSGVKASTLAMVRLVAPYFTDLMCGAKRIEEFSSIYSDAVTALAYGDQLLMAKSIKNAHEQLSRTGAVTPDLHDIICECLNLGALAAKITGAGGGGSILCLLNPELKSQQHESLQNSFGKDRVFFASVGQNL